MRLLMKISSVGKPVHRSDRQTQAIPNACAEIDNIMTIKNFVILSLCAFSLMAGVSHARTGTGHPTAVCFRRISAVSNKVETSNYEIILKKSSGNLSDDISRIRQFGVDYGPMKNPHIKPFVWIGAFVYDREFDGVRGPDCSDLPKIRPS